MLVMLVEYSKGGKKGWGEGGGLFCEPELSRAFMHAVSLICLSLTFEFYKCDMFRVDFTAILLVYSYLL